MIVDFSIYIIDIGFQCFDFDVVYLIVENGCVVFVDCGIGLLVLVMLQVLVDVGLGVDVVDWLLFMYVYLDYVGGVGLLMQQLFNVKVVLYLCGVLYMIDLIWLIVGVMVVYGVEEIVCSYGCIELIFEYCVVVVEDGYCIDFVGCELVLLYMLGYVLYYYCVWDVCSCSWFIGDMFGIFYCELDSVQGVFIFLIFLLVQFDLEVMKVLIWCMFDYVLQVMYLIYYGCVEQVEKLVGDLFEQIDVMVVIGCQCDGWLDCYCCLLVVLQVLYLECVQLYGCVLDDVVVIVVLVMDIEFNVQGLVCWLDCISRQIYVLCG